MVQSLVIRRGMRRMKTGLIYGFGGLVIVGSGLGLFGPGHPWVSVGLGLVAGALIFVVSWFTTGKTVQASEPSVGWIALDYCAKVALTISVLLLAKQVAALNVIVVAVLIIVAIIASTGIQVAAFTPAKRRIIAEEIEDR